MSKEERRRGKEKLTEKRKFECGEGREKINQKEKF
jgi:hypothetical protein